jgi:hypothetical protein
MSTPPKPSVAQKELDAVCDQLADLTVKDVATPALREPADTRDGSEDDELPSEAAECVNRTLVLIDFNGLLVFRDKKRVVKGIPPDFQDGSPANRYPFYVRAHAMEFIAQLAQDPRCQYALYTSMKRANMDTFVWHFDAYCAARGKTLRTPVCSNGSTISTASSLHGTRMCIFDRDFNARDPTGEDPWDTKRDLNLIWRRLPPEAQRRYNETNTILVECEARKARDWTRNTLCPSSFEAPLVGTDDTGLLRLGDALQNVFAKMQLRRMDVRDLLADVVL